MSARPNLVLVMTDQQRGDALSVDGHPRLMTPNLDELAGIGVRFRRAYSECPTCIPARYVLLTGRKPGRLGIVGFQTRARVPTAETLPELLRRAGYQTASVGRSMHTWPSSARYGFEIRMHSPFADPYSEFHAGFRFASRKGAFGNWPHLTGHGITSNGYTARPWPFEERFHQTNFAVNKAIEFLDGRDPDAPFFLYVGFVAPHPPFVPPACYYDRYAAMELDEPVVGDWAQPLSDGGLGQRVDGHQVELRGRFNQMARAGYYGLIQHVDDQFRLLWERLRMEPGPTYLLFCSDHGEMLGDHHLYRKGQPYEGSARIPMILHGPDLPEGVVVDRPVGLADILPTFLELAGVPAPDGADGQSLRIHLDARRDGAPRFVFSEHAALSALGPPPKPRGSHGHPNAHEAFQMVTDGRFKYVWFPQTGREQLFDLESDPRERHNALGEAALAEAEGTLRARLIEELAGRPEGFVRDGALTPNPVPYPHAHAHIAIGS